MPASTEPLRTRRDLYLGYPRPAHNQLSRSSGTPTSPHRTSVRTQCFGAQVRPRHSLPIVRSDTASVTGNENPYIFVSSSDVPVTDYMREKLKDRLRKYGFENVFETAEGVGKIGFSVVFPDSVEGQEAASRCYRSCNGTPFWGCSLRMKKFDSGFSISKVLRGISYQMLAQQYLFIWRNC